MAWKKTAGGRFSPDQKRKMVSLYLDDGMEISAIAEKAGCAWSSVSNILNKAGVKRRKVQMNPDTFDDPPKFRFIDAKKAEPDEEPEKEMPPILREALNGSDPLQEQDYLVWAMRGTVNKIGDKSYFEKLMEDFKSGRFGGG